LILSAASSAAGRRPTALRTDLAGLIQQSDRGVQYLSIRYTERLEEASIEPSVGGRGDSYDNAMAESVIGLYKTEVIRYEGPWRGLDEVEHATLQWVDWFNHQRLLEPIGYVPPAKFEKEYSRKTASEKDRVLRQTSLQEARGGSLFRWPYGGWRTWQPPGCRMGHG